MLEAQPDVELGGVAARSGHPVVEARHLRKAYGHVVALRDGSLEANPGEILGIVGDNGAGKSTLIKILAGVVDPDEGELEVYGKPAVWSDPMSARRGGISCVFQDLALVEALSVTANMFLGAELTRGPFVRRREMALQAAQRLAQLHIRVPSVSTAVGRLSGGQRQGVAVARAVLQGGGIVIMDEPTAALGVQETGRVEGIVQALRAEGRTIILVSHDLELVFRLADRITVMRLGSAVATVLTSAVDRDHVVGLITGSVAHKADAP
jgi:ABC-type sugar transport system ATPase subunit